MLTPQKRLQLAPAAAGFVLTGAMMMGASSAYAYEFKAGEVEGTVNTTITLGTKYDLEGYVTPSGNEQNENDGDRSFKKGFVSNTLKLTSELDLKKDNYGFSGRATAYYDHVLMNGSNQWEKNNQKDIDSGLYDESGTFDGWADEVKDNQGRGVKLQTAYVFGDWEFDGGQKLTARLGEQTHNWGETIFYGSGLMDLNAYDVALSTLPGSDGDLKLAQGMLQADLQFNDEITLSGFYQYDWEESILPGRGTYGSGEDLFIPGSDFGYKDLASFTTGGTTAEIDGLKQLLGLSQVSTTESYVAVADTSGTGSASNSGQWGTKLSFTPEFLENTEFAIYYANHHSSLPVVAVDLDSDSLTNAQSEVTTAGPSTDNSQTRGLLEGLHILNKSTYASTAYQEDIQLWGASFNTTVFGYTQIAGEVTYQRDFPIWIDHPDDLIAQILATSVANEAFLSNDNWNTWQAGLADPSRMATFGQTYENYELIDLWDASLSVIQPFGAVLGTDLMYTVVEVAAQQVSGLSNYDQYTAKGASEWYDADGNGTHETETDGAINADDRLDRLSWGYNLLVGANWNDVVMLGLNLESTFRFTDDVSGNSHLAGRFEEGEKKINLGLSANYDDMTASISWGGDADTVLRKGTITGTVGYTF